MTKVIVTTTIFQPTEAIRKFDTMPGWTLIVLGDKKTPNDFKLERGVYVSPDDQEQYDRKLSDAIGWNHVSRRNIGYLLAKDMGADVVAVVDDDNIPLPGWGENLMVGHEVEANYYETDDPAFDPVGATNYRHLWHRGFPLQLLTKRDYTNHRPRKVTAQIQADFWNGDPDIDAICRMEHAPECDFNPIYFPIASNKPSPFDSQNTFIEASVLKDYFPWTGIGRMDDIWASYYVQSLGSKVIYGAPSVYHARHAHDLVLDMRREFFGYTNNLAILKSLETLVTYIPADSMKAFELYRRHFTR